jgi:tetraacyldisaccharide 4'-kinase
MVCKVAGRIEEYWERVDIETFFLAPLAGLYYLGWKSYELPFQLGIKKSHQARQPVICVGSLMAGGASKSPVTQHLCQVLLDSGRRVVVSLSGYKSQRRKGAFLAPPGPLSAKVWGDETAAFRDVFPDVTIVTGKNRVLASDLAYEADPKAVFLMDDGFQHLELKKAVTLLLDPDPAPNPFLIPAGPYREPRAMGRQRASMCFPNPDFKVEGTAFSLEAHAGEGMENAWPSEVQVLCAIGRPHRLMQTLEAFGMKVVDARFLPDHDPMDSTDLWKPFKSNLPIVMTHKDWVKVRERDDWQGRTLLIAKLKVTIQPEAAFLTWLNSRLPPAP